MQFRNATIYPTIHTPPTSGKCTILVFPPSLCMTDCGIYIFSCSHIILGGGDPLAVYLYVRFEPANKRLAGGEGTLMNTGGTHA